MERGCADYKSADKKTSLAPDCGGEQRSVRLRGPSPRWRFGSAVAAPSRARYDPEPYAYGDSIMTSPAPAVQDPAAAPQSVSQQIAETAARLTYDALPARIRDRAKLHMLDVIGTALAATRFEFSHRALAGLLSLGENGTHTVIGMPVKLALRDAVLLNGILAHGLDYDDTHPGAIVHPSSSAFPCTLGVAEKLNTNGKDLIAAYVMAVDVSTRIGVAAGGAMHTCGFHTTGIAGHFGCAVGAGKLMGLDAGATRTCAGTRGQHGLGHLGASRRRRVEQAHASGLGRRGRHHGRFARARRLRRHAKNLRGRRRALPFAYRGALQRSRHRRDDTGPGRTLAAR